MKSWVGYIMSGGFLAGYRTKILAGALILDVFIKYALGDIALVDLVQQNWEQIFASLGLLSASVHKK